MEASQSSQTAFSSVKLTDAIPAQADNRPVTDPVPFPDLSHCGKSAYTAFDFSYVTPHKVDPKIVEMTRQRVVDLWNKQFDAKNLKNNLDFTTFKEHLHDFKKKYDGDITIEGYATSQGQKLNTVKWFWGHHIWFGNGAEKFEVGDHMGDKWLLDVVAWFTQYNLPFDTFQNKEILDVGTWTGATTYMLSALGAKHIYSVEEARKYSMFNHYVSESYKLPVTTVPRSLYDLERPDMQGKFDIVYFPGVLYHLSDPVLGLRILYNRLKIGGMIIVETMTGDGDQKCWYQRITGPGNNYFGTTPEILYNMLEDVGFERIVAGSVRRAEAFAIKVREKPMKLAGLARRDVC